MACLLGGKTCVATLHRVYAATSASPIELVLTLSSLLFRAELMFRLVGHHSDQRAFEPQATRDEPALTRDKPKLEQRQGRKGQA